MNNSQRCKGWLLSSPDQNALDLKIVFVEKLLSNTDEDSVKYNDISETLKLLKDYRDDEYSIKSSDIKNANIVRESSLYFEVDPNVRNITDAYEKKCALILLKEQLKPYQKNNLHITLNNPAH